MTGEVLKHLKVKTSSVKRLHKELSYYESERDKEQAKVDAMRASGADASDLKQAVSAATRVHVPRPSWPPKASPLKCF
jgi:hypothetical protein